MPTLLTCHWRPPWGSWEAAIAGNFSCQRCQRPTRRAVDAFVRLIMIPIGQDWIPSLFRLLGQLLGRGAANSQADARSQGGVDHRACQSSQRCSISLPGCDLVNENRPLDRIGAGPAHVLRQRRVPKVQRHDGQPLFESPVFLGLACDRFRMKRLEGTSPRVSERRNDIIDFVRGGSLSSRPASPLPLCQTAPAQKPGRVSDSGCRRRTRLVTPGAP